VGEAVQRWAIPGLAIVVVKDDAAVYAQGFGVRRLGDTARVTSKTVFAIGSCTKAFTATALAMLVDSGRASWDEPVTRYLRGFELSDPYVTRELTVRDLLTHRSGLMRGDALWYATPYDRAEVLRRIRYLKPSWSFRSRYGYQNIMFLAAGEVVPAVTGMPWDDFVRRRIFDPLGMTATGTSVAALDTAGASPRREQSRTCGRSVAQHRQHRAGWCDQVKYSTWPVGTAQLGGVVPGLRLVSAERVKEMHAPQMLIPLDSLIERLRPSTHFQAYGLGWTISDYRGRKLVAHGGAIDGFRALVGLVPEEQLGVVVLTNGGEPGRALTNALFLRVVDAFLGGVVRDWGAELLRVRDHRLMRDGVEDAKRAVAHRQNASSLALPAYAGSYHHDMYGDVVIAAESGALVMRFGPYYTGDLNHWHFDTFQAKWHDPEQGSDLVTFGLNADGKVDYLRWPGLGEFARAAERP
jgi:CubicO group peptidase (beta-lactamase class C family)